MSKGEIRRQRMVTFQIMYFEVLLHFAFSCLGNVWDKIHGRKGRSHLSHYRFQKGFSRKEFLCECIRVNKLLRYCQILWITFSHRIPWLYHSIPSWKLLDALQSNGTPFNLFLSSSCNDHKIATRKQLISSTFHIIRSKQVYEFTKGDGRWCWSLFVQVHNVHLLLTEQFLYAGNIAKQDREWSEAIFVWICIGAE